VFETAKSEAVRNSIFWELRYEKHENRIKGCDVEQKVSDWQMNAWSSLANIHRDKPTLQTDYETERQSDIWR